MASVIWESSYLPFKVAEHDFIPLESLLGGVVFLNAWFAMNQKMSMKVKEIKIFKLVVVSCMNSFMCLAFHDGGDGKSAQYIF